MPRGKLMLEFLWWHLKADDIIWDPAENEPVKAVYRTLDGRPRVNVVEYYFNEIVI